MGRLLALHCGASRISAVCPNRETLRVPSALYWLACRTEKVCQRLPNYHYRLVTTEVPKIHAAVNIDNSWHMTNRYVVLNGAATHEVCSRNPSSPKRSISTRLRTNFVVVVYRRSEFQPCKARETRRFTHLSGYLFIKPQGSQPSAIRRGHTRGHTDHQGKAIEQPGTGIFPQILSEGWKTSNI